MFENLKLALEKVRSGEYRITQTIKKEGLMETIHQTERNKIKALLRQALCEDIMQAFPKSNGGDDIIAYSTADGIVLEIPNESIADKIANISGSGAISAILDFSISSLNYNASDLAEVYAKDKADKEAKAKADEEKKAKKIALDKASREARAKKKAEEG